MENVYEVEIWYELCGQRYKASVVVIAEDWEEAEDTAKAHLFRHTKEAEPEIGTLRITDVINKKIASCSIDNLSQEK